MHRRFQILFVVTSSEEGAGPEISENLLDKVKPEKRLRVSRLWNDIYLHLHHITFNLDGDG